MAKNRYVTHDDLTEHHETHVKPTLDRMNTLADKLLGKEGDLDHPGYLARFHEVEKAHKMAKRGFIAAGLALATAGGKWLFDVFKNSGHSN